jgi:hypothetical protein
MSMLTHLVKNLNNIASCTSFAAPTLNHDYKINWVKYNLVPSTNNHFL